MSVVLLTTRPGTLSSAQERDSEAVLVNEQAIFARRDAIYCELTMNTLIQHERQRPSYTTRRSEHYIGQGYVLRIVHCGVFVPPEFLLIDDNSGFAPWGIWTLFKMDLNDNMQTFSVQDALEAYNLAKTYTYNYSSQHQDWAKKLSYM